MEKSQVMTVTPTLHVRPASVSDAAAISEMLHTIGWFKLVNAETQEETEARIASAIEAVAASDQDVIVVAADANERVYGYGAAHFFPNLIRVYEGYISELFIHPQARGQGAGGALLTELEAQGRKRGCTRIKLINLRIRESYQRAFYAKHGWQENADAAEFIRELDEKHEEI
jgi:GNAT superfamily N-acetyltransferase